MSKTVYVYGGWLPNAGALMAFEIGNLIAQRNCYNLTVIKARNETSPSQNFDYPTDASQISPDDFLKEQRSDDILVLNPSFQRPLLSLQCGCRILSYVQHFTTFQHLDLGAEKFVAVSQQVRRFLEATYDLRAPVINPFVPECDFIPPKSLSEKKGSFVVSPKGFPDTKTTLSSWLKANAAQCDLIELVSCPRREFLNSLNDHRFLLTLVVSEGFGLIPLEAMKLGSIVIGLDGYGGRDYARFGENSLMLPQSRLSELPGLMRSCNDYDLTRMSEAAKRTASGYSRDEFLMNWQNFLSRESFI